MMNDNTENSGEKPPRIKRGRFDSISIYEISDYELEILANGSPSSIYLNFAIFLISIGISFIISLLTTQIKSIYLFSSFLVIALIGLVNGLILLFYWNNNRKSISDIVKKIKLRIPSDDMPCNDSGKTENG